MAFQALKAVLTGGLAGSALTLLTQWAANWYSRPVLEVRFDGSEPGCIVKTNEIGGHSIVQCYVRLKILNSGRSIARDVSLCVTRLSLEAPGKGVIAFEEEVLDLKVALSGNPTFRLAPGAHRYIDLSHTQRMNAGAAFAIDCAITPVRLGILGLGPGTYRAEVFVSSENAGSARCTVAWAWDGHFPGLRIIEISNTK